MNPTRYITRCRRLAALGLGTAAAACLGWSAAAAGDAAAASIHIDLAQRKAPVPANLYGIFMEELSHAFDGGIYAELIQNRSFEEGVLPPGMKLVKQPNGTLKMELETLPSHRKA